MGYIGYYSLLSHRNKNNEKKIRRNRGENSPHNPYRCRLVAEFEKYATSHVADIAGLQGFEE